MTTSRLASCLILALAIPAVAHAQAVVPGFVPYCVSPSGGPWVPGERCVQPLVAPPTGVPAWMQPKAVAPPALPPPPVYVAPVSPGRGLDPWIPLVGQRPAAQSPVDLMTQLLLLQQLAAARQPPPASAPPVPTAPQRARVPPPPAPQRDGWMSAWIKGVQ